jgi:hypothetical protein
VIWSRNSVGEKISTSTSLAARAVRTAIPRFFGHKRQGLRFLRAELPIILATRSDVAGWNQVIYWARTASTTNRRASRAGGSDANLPRRIAQPESDGGA